MERILRLKSSKPIALGGNLAALSDRSRTRSELQGLLSARELRSPVDRVGPELLQILFPATRRNSVQRTGARRRFRPSDEIPAERRRAITFSIAIFSLATSCWWTGSPCFVDYQGGRKGALQYDIASLLFDAQGRPAAGAAPATARHYLDALARYTDLDREAFMQHYYALRLYPHHAGAWAPTASADSMSARRTSCRACPMR